MRDLVIFGAGGFAREAAVLVGSINQCRPQTYRLLGFVVDEEYFVPGTVINTVPVLGDINWLIAHRDEVCCNIAIGEPQPRKRIFQLLKDQGIKLETLISPEVYVDPSNKIGEGCYIGYRTVLSVNSVIGDGVFINTDCILGHDLGIGDYSTLWHRVTVSGDCTIGSGVQVGGGSYIIPKRKIGDNAVVAAGSVVFSNVKAGTHVLGNPAKRITL